MQLLLKQQRVGAKRDELLTRNDAFDDLTDLAMDERLAAGNSYHRRAAFIDRVEALLDRQTLVEDRVRIIDLAAGDAGEIAAEQRLQHQNERITFAAHDPLLEEIGRDANFLEIGNFHISSVLVRTVARRATCGKDWSRLYRRQFRRQPKLDRLLTAIQDRNFDRTKAGQGIDDALDQNLRRRGARGEAYGPHVLHPFRLQFTAVGDKIARDAGLQPDLAQAIGIRAVFRTDHQNDVDLPAQLAHRRLAILRGVTNIPHFGPDDIAEALFQLCDDSPGVVHAQRRLGYIGNRGISWDIELFNFFFGLHQHHGTGNLSYRAFDLRVAGVADQNEGAPLRDIALALVVNFGDQRTGGVEHGKAASRRLLLDTAGDAVRAEDGHRVFRYLGDRLNEAGAFSLEAVDHVLVVYDFVAHIDRRAVLLQRALDDLDRPPHSRAKATGLRQDNPQGQFLDHRFLRRI